MSLVFFFQAEDGIRDIGVTGVQTCALPISPFQEQLSNFSTHVKTFVTFKTPSNGWNRATYSKPVEGENGEISGFLDFFSNSLVLLFERAAE